MTDLLIYTDGGSRGNPGPAAIALLIYDEKDNLLVSHSEYIGETTNNVAEYRAVLKALRMAAKFRPGNVTCITDSVLVASQLGMKYKIKKPHLRELFDMVKEAERGLGSVKYSNVRREDRHISVADSMLNRTLDKISGAGK